MGFFDNVRAKAKEAKGKFDQYQREGDLRKAQELQRLRSERIKLEGQAKLKQARDNELKRIQRAKATIAGPKKKPLSSTPYTFGLGSGGSTGISLGMGQSKSRNQSFGFGGATIGSKPKKNKIFRVKIG